MLPRGQVVDENWLSFDFPGYWYEHIQQTPEFMFVKLLFKANAKHVFYILGMNRTEAPYSPLVLEVILSSVMIVRSGTTELGKLHLLPLRLHRQHQKRTQLHTLFQACSLTFYKYVLRN